MKIIKMKMHFLYVQYSYEYVEKTALPIIRPNYKSYPLEDRIGALNEMQDPNKTPVIIEKYPLSFIKRMTQNITYLILLH